MSKKMLCVLLAMLMMSACKNNDGIKSSWVQHVEMKPCKQLLEQESWNDAVTYELPYVETAEHFFGLDNISSVKVILFEDNNWNGEQNERYSVREYEGSRLVCEMDIHRHNTTHNQTNGAMKSLSKSVMEAENTYVYAGHSSVQEEVISSELGFDVGKKWDVEYSVEVDTPANGSSEERVYRIYREYHYDAYKDTLFGKQKWIAGGLAFECVGCFVVIQNRGEDCKSEETTNSNWLYPPVDMSKPLIDDPEVIKYLDYFIGPAQHVVFLEMDGEQISDKSMAVYSFLEAWMADPTSDHSDGYPKEKLDELSMKYFGEVPKTYESSMLTVNSQTGNVQSTGWGGGAYYHVLKDREELGDGKIRFVFDLIEPYSASYDLPITYEEFKHAVYSGQLDCVWPASTQKEYILSEHTDENGEFYVQYHSVSVVE